MDTLRVVPEDLRNISEGLKGFRVRSRDFTEAFRGLRGSGGLSGGIRRDAGGLRGFSGSFERV